MEETRAHLHHILVERFDKGELRTLCFHLGVDYDELPGEGVGDKARELITYLERRYNLSQLIEVGKQLRPDISWQEALEKSTAFQPSFPSALENVRRGCYTQVGQIKFVLILGLPLICVFLSLIAYYGGSMPLMPSPLRTSVAMASHTPISVAVASSTIQMVVPTETASPYRSVTATRIVMAVSPTPRETPTPSASSSERTPTAKPMATPLPTAINEPRTNTLLMPTNGALYRISIITFKWSGGALKPGETFIVEIIPEQVMRGECTSDFSRSGHQYSPSLTTHEWTIDINRPIGPGALPPCPGKIEWAVHIKDENGNIIATTPRQYFVWNPL